MSQGVGLMDFGWCRPLGAVPQGSWGVNIVKRQLLIVVLH